MTMWEACKAISDVTPGYSYGGGHDRHISKVRGSMRLDCSSAVSRALYLAGFFGARTWSLSSGDFEDWGVAGYGDDFTVMYKPRWLVKGHVYVQFHGKHAGWRFDTSPWGIGKTGPRLRKGGRGTIGFKPRHVHGH